MKLNKFIASAAALLIASTAAYADKAPFKVQSYVKPETNIWGQIVSATYLKITALDNVNLWDVKANRGNCEVIGEYKKELSGYPREELLKKVRENDGLYKTTKMDGKISRPVEYKLENGALQERTWFKEFKDNKGWGFWSTLLNYHMKYGESKQVKLNCSEILEVTLTTDNETWTFNFN